MKKIFFLGFIILISTSIKAQKAEIERKNLETTFLKQIVNKVEVQEITFPAGKSAPKHLHNCLVIGYVKSGTVLLQIEGEKSRIIKAGESFYEPKNVNILHFDNASKTEPMTFVAFYLKENEENNTELVKY